MTTACNVSDLVVDCKNRTPPVVENSEYAVVRTPNVRDGKFIKNGLRYTDYDSFLEWTARAIPQQGDVLITREAPLGEVCLVPVGNKICLGQRMMMYRPNQRKCDSQFLLYILCSSAVQKNLLSIFPMKKLLLPYEGLIVQKKSVYIWKTLLNFW